MNKNNPVGIIPIHTPILWKMRKALNNVFDELTEEELKALEKEIDSVTDYNCISAIKTIAEMYTADVRLACKDERGGQYD